MPSLPPRLQAKLRRHDRREWCGSLTPVEIIELVDDFKCQPTVGSASLPRRMRDYIADGKSGQWWFYFTPPRDLTITDKVHRRLYG